MDLLIRNKWITLRGSSVVKDLNEKDVMRVQGKFWTFTAKKFIQTMDKETKYVVRNKFWRLFAYRAFVLDPTGKEQIEAVKGISFDVVGICCDRESFRKSRLSFAY